MRLPGWVGHRVSVLDRSGDGRQTERGRAPDSTHERGACHTHRGGLCLANRLADQWKRAVGCLGANLEAVTLRPRQRNRPSVPNNRHAKACDAGVKPTALMANEEVWGLPLET